MKTYHELPTPSSDAAERSHALDLVIQQKIQQHNGLLPFADFMDIALYHPQHGYYQNPHFELGKDGDFTTAPEISPLFAHCFAKQCMEIFTGLGHSNIFELGAGSGRFAVDLLKSLESHNALPERYFIYEISESLRLKQQALFQTECRHLLPRVEWLSALPTSFAGIIIANEVLDAVPVNLFEIHDASAMERKIAFKDDNYVFQLDHPSTPQLQQEIEKLRIEHSLIDGYQSEINLGAMNLVQQLASSLTEGVILFADYGYGQREYYHPQRSEGSLACFYQHRLHTQPLIYPGLQDITAHIDFTRVIETAAAAGCSLLGFTTQSAFLLANNLLGEAQKAELALSDKDAFHLHQAVKTLTMPMEMGDRIKVMAIGRNFNQPLTGFSTLDRRRDL